ncbi:MAG: phenylalanine--tRNA ligase subunit beta, partial [Burkholderiales bacterium]|nr:phenylalanine--tRNA ligase subunit beta [Burkholderiales bacterium]
NELDDSIFTLKLTPNRADCLSLIGVARDVAAITTTSLYLAHGAVVAPQIADVLNVKAEADACPRYCGRIVRAIDMRAPTPAWMLRRLERSGIRGINAVVDVMNYVMLELGQPMHAFDLARIDRGIAVRYAGAGETLALLNGQTVALTSDMLVIADASKPLALAGIMGGADSAVSGTTADVFLESAFFNPQAIAGRTRRLGFATDSAHRFERGVDFAATGAALERATQLLIDVCGGKPGPVSAASGNLPRRDPVRLRAGRVERVLGVPFPARKISPLLRRLHLSFVEHDGEFHVTPHSYRFDLEREEDLIEEIARIHGYDRLPANKPHSELTMLPVPEAVRGVDGLKAQLVAREYHEIVSYSFVDQATESDIAGNPEPIALKNPIANHMSVMRSSLLGGLLEALRYNLNRQQARIRIFEIGRCFIRDADGIEQPERVAGLCYGAVFPEQWGAEARAVDIFDVKADLAALCAPLPLRTEVAQRDAFHPGRCARVFIDDRFSGWLGALHPKWQQKYGLPQAPVLFELECAALASTPLPKHLEVSKFPIVRRDLALLVDEKESAQIVIERLRQVARGKTVEFELFDVYCGQGVESGKKSLAFRILLQDTQKTQIDAEVDAFIAEILEVTGKKFGYKLRI